MKYLLWKRCPSAGLGTTAVEWDREELSLPLQKTLRIKGWEIGRECSDKEIKGVEICKAQSILVGSLETAWDGDSWTDDLLRKHS